MVSHVRDICGAVHHQPTLEGDLDSSDGFLTLQVTAALHVWNIKLCICLC